MAFQETMNAVGDQADEVTGKSSPRLWDVATLLLKLGVMFFGGSAGHIALMREKAVRRRNWVSDEQCLDRRVLTFGITPRGHQGPRVGASSIDRSKGRAQTRDGSHQ